MALLEIVLLPFVWVMNHLLDFGFLLTGSAGVSIIFLSLCTSLALYPLQKAAHRIEAKFSEKYTKVQNAEKQLDQSLRGEEKFLAQEKIYQKFSYHPIQQLYMSLGVLVSIPVLISAILLFSDHAMIAGEKFLFIRDLSLPDGLVAGANLMPVLMFLVTLFDALWRFRSNKSMLRRFLFISVVLFVLVYGLPSALILYWIGSNVVSLILYQIQASSRDLKQI